METGSRIFIMFNLNWVRYKNYFFVLYDLDICVDRKIKVFDENGNSAGYKYDYNIKNYSAKIGKYHYLKKISDKNWLTEHSKIFQFNYNKYYLVDFTSFRNHNNSDISYLIQNICSSYLPHETVFSERFSHINKKPYWIKDYLYKYSEINKYELIYSYNNAICSYGIFREIKLSNMLKLNIRKYKYEFENSALLEANLFLLNDYLKPLKIDEIQNYNIKILILISQLINSHKSLNHGKKWNENK